MKKLFIIAFFGIFSFSNAQKGSYLIDGSIGFNTSRSSDGSGWNNSSSTFNFLPKVGYQFNENWTAGLQLGFSIGSGENSNYQYPESYATDKSNGYSYGFFLRYNKKISDVFLFFTDINLGFNNGESTSENYSSPGVKNTNTSSYNGYSANIIPAIALNIKNNFRLNINFGGLGYNYSHKENNSGNYSNNNNFGINFGQTYAFGISKNF